VHASLVDTRTPLLDVEEVELRLIAIIGFALAVGASVPVAIAQTEQPIVHHHVHHYVGPHHTIHHHYVAPGPAVAPAPVVAAPPAPQAGPFGLALPHIAPYPNGKGDEDGLSEDEDDCNKGCIDGNTPD
jgi:hypothetical protein